MFIISINVTDRQMQLLVVTRELTTPLEPPTSTCPAQRTLRCCGIHTFLRDQACEYRFQQYKWHNYLRHETQTHTVFQHSDALTSTMPETIRFLSVGAWTSWWPPGWPLVTESPLVGYTQLLSQLWKTHKGFKRTQLIVFGSFCRTLAVILASDYFIFYPLYKIIILIFISKLTVTDFTEPPPPPTLRHCFTETLRPPPPLHKRP